MANYFLYTIDKGIDEFSSIDGGFTFKLTTTELDSDLALNPGDIIIGVNPPNTSYVFEVIRHLSVEVELVKKLEIGTAPNLSGNRKSNFTQIKKEEYQRFINDLLSNYGVQLNDNEDSDKVNIELNLLNDFIKWFISHEGVTHNYYKNSFNSDQANLRDSLLLYEKIYQQEFNSFVFTINVSNIEKFIETLENNLGKKNGKFFDYSSVKSNHMPRAILGNKNYLKFLRERNIKPPSLDEKEHHDSTPKSFDISGFSEACRKVGLIYSDKLISRFTASLLTKPFVILTGLSGSGKTKLAQSFIKWICSEEKQYSIVPVGADWTNREPILGFLNALKQDEYIKPDNGVLDLIINANEDPYHPYFLLLDEMNLSQVERYFADFLSVMESGEAIPIYSNDLKVEKVPPKITLPPNLFIIGTVNIDETTNMFSPKVLDRANTIEFRVRSSEMTDFLNNSSVLNNADIISSGNNMAKDFIKIASSSSQQSNTNHEKLINTPLLKFFEELQKSGAEFGYRSAKEILILINRLDIVNNQLTIDEKIDIAIMQKLLPKLHGSRRKLLPILETLAGFCVTEGVDVNKEVFNSPEFNFNRTDLVIYPLSLEKIIRMYYGAIDNGFASYAEA